MKIILFVIALLGLLYGVFLSFHSKSIDRAWLVKSTHALLAAQEELRTNGTFTNHSESLHLQILTNALTVDGRLFQPELAAYLPAWTNVGYMILTTNGVFIWNDANRGAMIIGGPGFESKVPSRFKDF